MGGEGGLRGGSPRGPALGLRAEAGGSAAAHSSSRSLDVSDTCCSPFSSPSSPVPSSLHLPSASPPARAPTTPSSAQETQGLGSQDC